MRRLSPMAGAPRSNSILLFLVLVTIAHAKLIDMRLNLGGEAVDGFAAEEEVLDLDENYSKMRYHGEIKGGADHMNVFRTQRFSRYEDLLIHIPVPDGVYTVTLLFAETWKGAFGPGKRVFDVYLGSKPGGIVKVLDQFDAFKSGGPAAAVRRKFEYIATQGGLTIALRPIVQNPQIAGAMIQGYSYSNALIDELPTIPAPTGGNEDFSVLSGIGPRIPSDPSLVYDPTLNPKLRKNSAGSSSSSSASMGGRSYSDADAMSHSAVSAPPASSASMNAYQPPTARSQASTAGQYGARPSPHSGSSAGGPPVPPIPQRGHSYGSGQAPTAPSAPQGYGQAGASGYNGYSGGDGATHGYGTTQYGGYGHHAVYRRRLNSIPPETDGFAGMPPPPDMYAQNPMGQGQGPPPGAPGAFPPSTYDFPPGAPDGMQPQLPLSEAGVVRAFEHNPFAMAPPLQQDHPFPDQQDHAGTPPAPQDMPMSGPAAEFARNQMEAALAAQQEPGASPSQQMPSLSQDALPPPSQGQEMPAPPVTNAFEMAPPVPAGTQQATSDGSIHGGFPSGAANGAFENSDVPPPSGIGSPAMGSQGAYAQQPPSGLQNNFGMQDISSQQGQAPLDPAMHHQALPQAPEQQQPVADQQQPVAEQQQRMTEQIQQTQEQQQHTTEQTQQSGEQQQQTSEQQLQIPSQLQQSTEAQQKVPEQAEQIPAQPQQVVDQKQEALAGQQTMSTLSVPEQTGLAQPAMQLLSPEQQANGQPMAQPVPAQPGTDLNAAQLENGQAATAQPIPTQPGTDINTAQPGNGQAATVQSVMDQTASQTSGQEIGQQTVGTGLSLGNSLSLLGATEQQVKTSDNPAENPAAPAFNQAQLSTAQTPPMDLSSVLQNAPAQPVAAQAAPAQSAQSKLQQMASQPQAAQSSVSSTDASDQASFVEGVAQSLQQGASGVTSHREFQAQSENLQKIVEQATQPQLSGEGTSAASAALQSAPAAQTRLSQANSVPQATAGDVQNAAVSGTTGQLTNMQQPVTVQQDLGTSYTGQSQSGANLGGVTNYARPGVPSTLETAIVQSQVSASSTQGQAFSSSSGPTDPSGATAGLQGSQSVGGATVPGAFAAQVPSASDKLVTQTVARTLTNLGGGVVGGNSVPMTQGFAISKAPTEMATQNSQYVNALRQVAGMMSSLRGDVSGNAAATTAAADTRHTQMGELGTGGTLSAASSTNTNDVQGVSRVESMTSARGNSPSHDGTVRTPLGVGAVQATAAPQMTGAAANGFAVSGTSRSTTQGQPTVSDQSNPPGPGIVGNGGLDGLCLHNSTHCSCGMVESPNPEECLFVVNENENPMICIRRSCSGKMVCACAPGANMLCRRTAVKTILVPATTGKKVSDFGSSDNTLPCKRETLDDGVEVYMPV